MGPYISDISDHIYIYMVIYISDHIYLDIYLEKMKVLIQKDICIPMLIATQFTIAETWIQTKCPPIDA